MIDFTGIRFDRANGYMKKMMKGCTSIEKVVFDISSGAWNSIEESAFEGCTALREIVIGSKVNSVGANAFKGCSALESVEFKSTGFTVASTAFDANNVLEVFVMSESDKTALLTSCTNLTKDNVTVIVNGNDGDCTWVLQGDILTISGGGSLSGEASWASYADGIKKVIVESTVGSVSSEYFASLADKSVTFVTYPTCSAATVVRKMQKSNENISLEYDSSLSREGVQSISDWMGNTSYSWQFDDKTGKLYITSKDRYQFVCLSYSGVTLFHSWVAIWKDAIVSVEFDSYITEIKVDNVPWFTSGLVNLKSVKFNASDIVVNDASEDYYKGVGIFEGCTSLTTVGAGRNYQEGVVNLSNFKMNKHSKCSGWQNMFKGCSSVTKVIYDIASGSSEANIVSDSFEGCISLAEIVIGENVASVKSGAFNGCTSLKKIVLSNPNTVFAADAFGSCSGIKLYSGTFEQAITIGNTLAELGISNDVVTVLATVGGMSVDGFQIRTSGKNGLRVRFVFDESILTEENDGYNFVEYGSIAASAENYEKYTHDIGGENSILVFENGEIKTSDKMIKKITVRGTDGFNDDAKYTEDNGNIRFNVAVVNYIQKAHAMSDVSVVGYEIWEKNGEYFAIFTEQDVAEYNILSLYKVTLGMLSDGALELENNEESPVYKTVEMCAESKLDSGVENVSAFILQDPISAGKYIVAFVNSGDEVAEIESISFIDEEIRNNISDIIYGKNVLEFTLPEIAGYWQEHIDEKLVSLHEGKQFIYIVDTHWDGNKKKSTDYIKR